MTPDQKILHDHWSDLSALIAKPEINIERLHAYRLQRIRSALQAEDAAMCLLVSPVSLRYATDYRSYALFQSHIPTAYLFVPAEGPVITHGGYAPDLGAVDIRQRRPLSFFDGGYELDAAADLLATDVINFLAEIGTDNRRIAVEYVNPSITQTLMRRGLEVIDGVRIVEQARLIKSADEIACMRWSIAVAEHGIASMLDVMRPGVTELQLWALLNYTNLANNGDWHDGRMLASGVRTNPWCQEATQKRLEDGELVGFDTDMVGPYGYCADISRTVYCGSGKPTDRQKQLYRIALDEIEYNTQLVKPGVTLHEFQQKAFEVAEEYRERAYPCVIHGIGMCDEYPRVNPKFRGANPYNDTLQAGMVICIESFVATTADKEGVKLEQQVLITDDGCELLTQFPYDQRLMD